MTVTVQDTIERQLVIPVARQRIWDAISAPDQIAKWFSDNVTMQLEPGSPIVFHWDGYGDRREQMIRGNTEGWIMKTTALLDYLVAEPSDR